MESFVPIEDATRPKCTDWRGHDYQELHADPDDETSEVIGYLCSRCQDMYYVDDD